MAFLDILNLPSLLRTETHSFKRANVYDKLDLGLADSCTGEESPRPDICGHVTREAACRRPGWSGL